jgi:DNA-binding transcriptional LysR family regulator
MMNSSRRVNIETELLRVFVTVVETRGFTRAARALNRTQSAVSMQIKRLEERIGRRLFERNGRAVSLSRDGEALVSYARRILRINDEVLEAISRPEVEGVVRLGVIEDYATVVLPQILAHFAAEHARVYVELQTGLTVHLLERLGAPFDLVLGMQPAGRSGDGEAIRREAAMWVGSRVHAAHERSPLPLALYPNGCLFREWALSALDRAGRQWRITYMSPSLAAVEAAVAAGLAVTVVKAGTMPKNLRSLGPKDGLPRLPVAEIVLYRAPRRLSKAATLLGDYIRETLRTRAS